MNKEIHVSIRLLQEEIQSKFGRRILYAHDCDELSMIIKNQTHRQVSCSTLKRFFGLIKSPYGLSNYTLDTLSIFLQYHDWREFQQNYEKGKFNYLDRETTDNLKKSFDAITAMTLQSLKKTGIQPYIPSRRFAEKKTDRFLNSQKIATAFIAPAGYGKSTIIAQLTEKFFTSKDAKYPDDIVALVNNTELYNQVVHHKKIDQLDDLMMNDARDSMNPAFNSGKRLLKGRFILIIDDLDAIITQNPDYHLENLTEILILHAKCDWFKTILTCTPKIWRQLSSHIGKSHLLKSRWFDVSFQGSDEELINIPPLKKREIRLILEKNDYPLSLHELNFHFPDVSGLIKIPHLMQLFLSAAKPAASDSDVDVLHHYISSTLLSPFNHQENGSVLQSYFVLCSHAKKSAEIRKSDLNLSPSIQQGYEALIRRGVLCEQLEDENDMKIPYVKFTRNIRFTHYLANLLVDENKLNIEFLRNLMIEYQHIPSLQIRVLIHIITLLYKNQKIELLKNIFSVRDTDQPAGDKATFDRLDYVLTNVSGIEMRKNRPLSEILIPIYARCADGRALYFEKYVDFDRLVLNSGNELDHYIRYSKTNEERLYAHYMKFMRYFLCENKELCTSELEQILRPGNNEGNSVLNAIHYFIPQVIYQSVYAGKPEEGLMSAIYRESEKFLMQGIQNRSGIPEFEFSAILALNFGGLNHEIIRLSQYINETFDLTDHTDSCYYKLFQAVYSKALLETGETLPGTDLFKQVKSGKVIFPLNRKYYFRIMFMLIEAEFLIYQKKLIKACRKLEKIKHISSMLKFSYFNHRASDISNNMVALA